MMDLLAEMKQCKTVDANGDDEAATGWNEVC